MLAYEIVRSAIPEASEDLCEYVIWERTPFPFRKITPRDLFKAASGYRRASFKGIVLCDHCHRIATEGFLCTRCKDALSKL